MLAMIWPVRILACFGVAACCFAQDVSRMDQVVQSYVSEKKFMGSVLVARGDETLFSKGYGSANLEWNIPNSPNTKFRLGSVTKQFTAAAILLLDERGKLKIDDLVRKFVPDAPAAWDKITLYHLLTHTSGIPNFTNFPDYRSQEPFPATPEQLVARFRDKPLDFQPGEKWSYSNSGYVLLGYVLEKASGESYQAFLQKNIFDPLGMKDSGYDSNSAVIKSRASGYAPSDNGGFPLNAGFIHMSIPFSAGALYSTTEDLLKWERGLFGGKVLSLASLAKMTTPFKEDYACGVSVRTIKGHKVIDHGGGIEGFTTFLAYYPESKTTVISLSNIGGPAPQEMTPLLAAIAQGETVELPSERKVITVAPEVLKGYVGTYQMAPQMNMMVRLTDGQLTAQLSGQGSLPLFAKSESVFFPKLVNAEIEFGKDYLVLHQGGHDQKALRTSETVIEKKEVAVPISVLQRYVGIYELHPGFELVVTLEGNQLITQTAGQSKIPLFAESETRFFPKVMDAEIEFFTDANGAVSHLVLHQGSTEMKGTRK